MSEPSAYEGWCVMEMMGHRRLAGYVRQVELAGAGLLRLDVPSDDPETPAATQFYSPAALYCLTPCTEDVARRFAIRNRPVPVSRYELPAPSPVGSSSRTDDPLAETRDVDFGDEPDEDEDDGL